MALSGLDIFKLLPKTNCGDCGIPTCMAFAMKLAQKKAELSECPHASDEAKSTLGAASEPPMRLVRIEKGDKILEVGNETVMFRHEKTFFHQPGIAIKLKSSEDEAALIEKIKIIENYKPIRVGEELNLDLIFITNDSKEEDFIRAVELINKHSTMGIIFDCANKEILEAGLSMLENSCPAIFLNNNVTDKDIDIAKSFNSSLILTADSIENIIEQEAKTREAGLNNIILNIKSSNIGQIIQANTIFRRSALKNNFKPFGYPLFIDVKDEDKFDILSKASAYVCKYDSIILLHELDPAMLYTLFTLRQNIYTDPQKPIQVDAKIYEIGNPTQESPVFVTTNFSLTYFIVSGEIENSGISAYLVVCDCEGQSVLTAWAAGKFIGESIANFIRESKLESIVKTRKLIIPGYVAQISGDLEEKLPGWEVIVGCQEASDIPYFVKSVDVN